jgi:DNA-binding XRE family transcriptional regulator
VPELLRIGDLRSGRSRRFWWGREDRKRVAGREALLARGARCVPLNRAPGGILRARPFATAQVSSIIDTQMAATAMSPKFGQRLRALREREGVSMHRIARRARVLATTVMYVERGKTVPSLAVAERLAASLDTTPGRTA